MFELQKQLGQWWLINREGLTNPTLTLLSYLGLNLWEF